jgi:cell division protein ZapE
MSSVGPVTTQWQKAIDEERITFDKEQQRVCCALDSIAVSLAQKRSWWQFAWGRVIPKGFYLWGKVGRGKTFLVDLFIETLDPQRVERWHFHRLMATVHAQMATLVGTKEPLHQIATRLAQTTQVLCLDELFVEDIGDAMILGRLFEALIAQGVVLVCTSNCAPDDLYRNGLQRQKFIPAIEALKAHCHVTSLDGPHDWRMQHFEHLPLYLCPADAAAHDALEASFDELRTTTLQSTQLVINERTINCVARSGGLLWLSFSALCRQPTGARDYVELARTFDTIILEHIERLTDSDSAAVVRFVHLIDELYDRNVKLFISAQMPIHQLYEGRAHAFAFERCKSRLFEMQTSAYLSQAHRP